MSNVIAAEWASYAAAVLPKTAPPVQRTECERAFYAGAAGLFHAIMTILEPGAEPTEADLEHFSGIEGELDAFAARVGRAAADEAGPPRQGAREPAPIIPADQAAALYGPRIAALLDGFHAAAKRANVAGIATIIVDEGARGLGVRVVSTGRPESAARELAKHMAIIASDLGQRMSKTAGSA